MGIIVILGEREAEITFQVFELKAMEQIIANGSWLQNTRMQRSHKMKLEYVTGDETDYLVRSLGVNYIPREIKCT